ncbi:hypothetical protein D3C75_637510 [compost metagenome]
MEVDFRLHHVADLSELDLPGEIDRRCAIETLRRRVEAETAQFEGEQIEQRKAFLRVQRLLERYMSGQHPRIAG